MRFSPLAVYCPRLEARLLASARNPTGGVLMPGVHPIRAREVLSVKEVMEQSGFPYATIRRAIDSGKLKKTNPHSKFLLHVSDVNRWLRDFNMGRA